MIACFDLSTNQVALPKTIDSNNWQGSVCFSKYFVALTTFVKISICGLIVRAIVVGFKWGLFTPVINILVIHRYFAVAIYCSIIALAYHFNASF